MITRNKVVLVVKDEHTMKDINYEAIEVITDASGVQDVWRRNKTPAMLEKDAHEVMNEYPYIITPEFIFGAEYFISFCHRNGFECGEFISGKKFDTSKDRCFLCAVGNHADKEGNQLNPLFIFNQMTPEINDIILYESEHFFVKIEYGCMKKGMLMICPKEHYMSAARIPYKQMAEYELVKKDVEFLLKAVYAMSQLSFLSMEQHRTALQVMNVQSFMHIHM